MCAKNYQSIPNGSRVMPISANWPRTDGRTHKSIIEHTPKVDFSRSVAFSSGREITWTFQPYVYWRKASQVRKLNWMPPLLRKHTYSNTRMTSQPKKSENFQIKVSDIFLYFCSIDCGYSLEPPWRGGSNEYPQSLFLSRNKKNNVYPC